MRDLEVDGEILKMDESEEPGSVPWFDQFLKLSDSKRRQIIDRLKGQIKAKKPEAYNFIKNTDAKLVGVMPQVSYALRDSKENDGDITWVHGFSMCTLLFWCEKGGFGFFINPNLDYNDTVLNKVEGNRKQSLKGFTA
jgi:hypothetical protein